MSAYRVFFFLLLLLLLALGVYVIIRLRIRRLRMRYLAEDILKHFATISSETLPRKEVIGWLEGSPDRAERALEKACSEGWVIPVHDGEQITVTQKGLAYGRQMLRRHRIIETYLAEQTGYPREETHRRAEQLEHRLSCQEIDRMARTLRYPVVDASGEPIPTTSGEIPQVHYLCLYTAPEGAYRIGSINDKNEELYKCLMEAGIHRGTPVQLIRKAQELILKGPLAEVSIPSYRRQDIHLLPTDPEGSLLYCDSLWNLRRGEKARIIGMDGYLVGERRRRLADLGFVKGAEITVYMPGPLDKPRAYVIRDTAIALRKDQAEHILIRRYESA